MQGFLICALYPDQLLDGPGFFLALALYHVGTLSGEVFQQAVQMAQGVGPVQVKDAGVEVPLL